MWITCPLCEETILNTLAMRGKFVELYHKQFDGVTYDLIEVKIKVF